MCWEIHHIKILFHRTDLGLEMNMIFALVIIKSTLLICKIGTVFLFNLFY